MVAHRDEFKATSAPSGYNKRSACDELAFSKDLFSALRVAFLLQGYIRSAFDRLLLDVLSKTCQIIGSGKAEQSSDLKDECRGASGVAEVVSFSGCCGVLRRTLLFLSPVKRQCL